MIEFINGMFVWQFFAVWQVSLSHIITNSDFILLSSHELIYTNKRVEEMFNFED